MSYHAPPAWLLPVMLLLGAPGIVLAVSAALVIAGALLILTSWKMTAWILIALGAVIALALLSAWTWAFFTQKRRL